MSTNGVPEPSSMSTTNSTSGINSEGRKVFLPLENNPSTLTPLAHTLGLSPSYALHDLYSFTDADLLALVPRPALALLFVYPHTDGAQARHRAEVEAEQDYNGSGDEDPVLWFRQIVVNCCGLMGIIHCTLNAHHALPATATATATSTADTPIILPDSTLANLRAAALPLRPGPRADLIATSPAIEAAHAAAAVKGDTVPPALGEDPGHAFIAFVRGADGMLYEMDGCRKGPKCLGKLEDEGVEGGGLLGRKALEMTVLPYVEQEMGGDGLAGEFSCCVLAPVGGE
ncbi:uncharacterized protein HMPREF1541_03326 [Cyphellophora europaea CBS 101466]|uniref:Ubiquitin carboxyl-terminal hydrolase n=1 Tax=Cyphellophora europaea (strain CBS 101466) TaxID=1220924 RepID=W2RY29_CYPE1|nr:uncharacterized protein HMPREF1541_03326 [Cyphellophora europaea CBS 101466]ETN41391.1 hypothetical protein HMPREF1541_03326 [Cyphellophora europaea CBS 101466]